MSVLTVGANKQYSTINAAIRDTHDGDTVMVQAGTYLNDFSTITHKITLQSVGGLAILKATDQPSNGKAILTTGTDVVIDGFGFTGAAVSDNNGAGIRYEGGHLVVRNSVFWDNQDGILGGADPNGTILIQNSEFSHNGAGDGYTHNIYIGNIKSAVIENSYFHDAIQGHEIKSRAQSTTITGNRIFDNQADTSYSIDIPDGGAALIENNIIEKGVNAPNYTTIHFGGENGPYANSSLTIRGNTIINDNEQGFLLNNAAGTRTTMADNKVFGFAADHKFQNATAPLVTETGTTLLTERPVLDLTSIAPTVVYNPPPTVIEVPPDSPYATFGIQGAVTATGHILTVGAHGQFQSLAAALTASQDGDTIQVAAGTYLNDFGQVNQKVIIEGVGGIARFTQDRSVYGQRGLLMVNTDATLKNLEFSGGHGGGNSHEGGVLITNGNTTIVNSRFIDNDTGILAFNNAHTTVSVFGSEIGANGNYDKGTHNLTIGAIASFTLKDSYVHGALTGHEISDRAYNTVIEGNRILDGANAEASFGIGLGQGGNAIIRNNVIEKGPQAANGVSLLVGGEGLLYDNTNVQITGNTLVSNLSNLYHPYTYFLNASRDATGLVTATNNTFVGGVNGSSQVANIEATGSRVAASALLDRSSPVSGSLGQQVMAATPDGARSIKLQLGQVRGNVDAQFVVKMDGAVVGGGVVRSTGPGMSDSFEFKGNWAVGAHKIEVVATNIFSQKTEFGSVSAGSLMVNRVELDGHVHTPAQTLDIWNTGCSIDCAVTTPPPVVVAARPAAAPIFDAAYYLAHNPDVARAGVDPEWHFRGWGWREGRDPNAWFSTKYYLDHNPDVARAGVEPLAHFTGWGWKEGRDVSATFSTKAYLAAHPDTSDTSFTALLATAQSGQSIAAPLPVTVTVAPVAQPTSWTQMAMPGGGWFDASYYLHNNADVARAGIDPLKHYEGWGWTEGRTANPYFSASAYTTAHPDAARSGVDPMLAFLGSSEATATPYASPYLTAEASKFDVGYYLAHNPDVAAAHVDALFHYQNWGWQEHRDPSASFSTDKYLGAYADVKNAGIDPLNHFAATGAAEGRHAFAV